MKIDQVANENLAAGAALASQPASPATVTHYRTKKIDGINIFYRETGPKDALVVLLLHGFPTSSHMFRNLIPALADRYRLIAPDYPGYGQSDMPDRAKFAYTFGRAREQAARVASQIRQPTTDRGRRGSRHESRAQPRQGAVCQARHRRMDRAPPGPSDHR